MEERGEGEGGVANCRGNLFLGGVYCTSDEKDNTYL